MGDRMNQQEILELWPPSAGYDIFYMPSCCLHRKNLGFAFMNFVEHTDALAFKEQWNSQQINSSRNKAIQVDWAATQGYKAHMDIINGYGKEVIKSMGFQPMVIVRLNS